MFFLCEKILETNTYIQAIYKHPRFWGLFFNGNLPTKCPVRPEMDEPGETQEILDQAAKSRKPIHQDQAAALVMIELCSRFFCFLVVEYEVDKITQQRKPPERQRLFFSMKFWWVAVGKLISLLL